MLAVPSGSLISFLQKTQSLLWSVMWCKGWLLVSHRVQVRIRPVGRSGNHGQQKRNGILRWRSLSLQHQEVIAWHVALL